MLGQEVGQTADSKWSRRFFIRETEEKLPVVGKKPHVLLPMRELDA